MRMGDNHPVDVDEVVVAPGEPAIVETVVCTAFSECQQKSGDFPVDFQYTMVSGLVVKTLEAFRRERAQELHRLFVQPKYPREVTRVRVSEQHSDYLRAHAPT